MNITNSSPGRPGPQTHPDHETLELYALGRLPDGTAVELEEHVLICEPCQLELEETVEFAESMRDEMKRRQFGAAEPRGIPALVGSWVGWFRSPAFAMGAMAVALVGVGVSWQSLRGPGLPLATVQLAAIRGEMPDVPAARETDLTLANAMLPGGRVEVVNADGKTVWSENLAPGGTVKVRQALARGEYFVRLYNGEDLVHEYGFRVKK